MKVSIISMVSLNNETNPYKTVKKFIKERGYSYHVGDVVEGYYKRLEGYYNSYTMNDCIDHLEDELKQLMDRY